MRRLVIAAVLILAMFCGSASAAQIRLTAGEVEVIVTLNNSKAAADLVTMLPLTLTLIERNNFAKGMTLPRGLNTDEATTRKYYRLF